MEDYPKLLTHPQAMPAQLVENAIATGTPARPARYPPIQVGSADQEAEYRAKGYLAPGEPLPSVPGWAEFPKMLVHPEHVDAIPDVTTANRIDGNLVTSIIRGSPEKFPNVFVKNADEEAAWTAKGYAPPGVEDPAAFGRATSSALPDSYEHDEWPKWVDGTLVDDPSKPPPGADAYPKMVYGPPDPGQHDGKAYTVHSRKEELELLSKLGVPVPAELIVPEPKPAAVTDDHKAEFLEFLAWKVAQKVAAETEAAMATPNHEPNVFAPPIIEAAVAIAEVVAENGLSERAKLLAEADRRGVRIDRRWNEKKLRQALEAS